MVNVTMSITIMFVILMVVIAVMKIHGLIRILLEMVSAATFITLKCAIMTKGIVVTAIELLTGSVMTQTITEFVIMMEEIAALEILIQVVVLSVHASKSLM